MAMGRQPVLSAAVKKRRIMESFRLPLGPDQTRSRQVSWTLPEKCIHLFHSTSVGRNLLSARLWNAIEKKTRLSLV